MNACDLRVEKRSTMFLAAELTDGAVKGECRIRNLSSRGAMIQTKIAAPVGTELTLERGELTANATVVWQKGSSFGLCFRGPVEVQDWLREGAPLAQQAYRSSSVHTYLDKHADTAASMNVQSLDELTFISRLSDELSYISRMLETVSELLVNDPFLRVRHSIRLQNLVSGQQTLLELSKIVLCGEDKLLAVETLASGPMRQRLLRRQL